LRTRESFEGLGAFGSGLFSGAAAVGMEGRGL
jgi:hypothetical protein